MNLKDNTILLTVSGSRAYGMHHKDSDVDLQGILIPDKEYFLGFNKRCEQYNSSSDMQVFIPFLNEEEQDIVRRTKIEGTVFAIQKFFSLAADCNPNLIQMLFSDKENIVLKTRWGERLIENRDAFLSKNARFRFAGYAMAQLKRIELHRSHLLNPIEERPKREDFGLKDLPEIPKSELLAAKAHINKQLDRWNDGFVGSLEESQKIQIRESIAQLLSELHISEANRIQLACNRLGFDTSFTMYFQKEAEYSRAVQKWEQYQEWKKNRNPERAKMEAEFGYDGKHAAHLIRLMRMCVEILETGEVHVRRPDAQELLSIRAGAYSYERLIEYAKELEEKAAQLYLSSSLRKSPDKNFLDSLCLDIVDDFLQQKDSDAYYAKLEKQNETLQPADWFSWIEGDEPDELEEY